MDTYSANVASSLVTCDDEPRNPTTPPSVNESKKEEVVAPQPPKWILEALKKFKGKEPRLIIAEKELFASDVDQNQSRLMFPENQVLSKEFLRKEESTILRGSSKAAPKQGVPVIFVDPQFKTYRVSLKQWTKNMVISGWKDVLLGYKFEVGQKYPLWCFRSEETLHFALVPKEKECSYLDDFKNLNDVWTMLQGNDDEEWFCLEDFTQLDLFRDSEYANVEALPDLGPFDDVDVDAYYVDDA